MEFDNSVKKKKAALVDVIKGSSSFCTASSIFWQLFKTPVTYSGCINLWRLIYDHVVMEGKGKKKKKKKDIELSQNQAPECISGHQTLIFQDN